MFKKIIALVFLLLVAVAGAVITIKNTQAVPFDYYFGSLNLPLFLYLFAAFAAGIILTALVASWSIFKRNRQIKRLQKNTPQ